MRCERWAACCAAIILFWVDAARAVELGEPLAAALEELRATGLQLIFSSALIEPAFTVNVEPGTGTPEQIARRILAPHGLALDAVRTGLFAVVKRNTQDVSPNTPLLGTLPGKPLENAEPLPEISVYASRYEIEAQQPKSLAQFTREDLDRLPGLNEDVLRVTHYLPGTASNALSARSHVRGGRDDELAVFFDGVPLFEPFHFKDVQGLFGILDPQSISTMNFYSGVFPAHYGNRLSGVLDIQPREWGGKSYHAIGASLLYTHVLSQGRLDSYPVEWLASVRRGNVGLLAKALNRDEAEPDFVDTLGRIRLDLGNRASLALGWLLLDDGLEVMLPDERADINYRDATGWLSWHFNIDDDRELQATFSRTERHTSRDGSMEQLGGATGTVDDERNFDTTTARLEGTARLNDRLRLNGGLELYAYDADYDYSSELAIDPLLAGAFARPEAILRADDFLVTGEAYAAYASALLSLTERTKLDLGLRWDAQRFGTAFNGNQVSPRLSFQFERDPTTVLRLSWGRLTQTQRPDELAVQDGDPTFHPAQRAEQMVASVERRARRNLLWRVEAFDKQVYNPIPSYENLLDPFVLLPELAVDRVRIAPDRSHAYGAELSLRWELPPRWLGWASYSWSQARDRFDERSVPRTWDQRHSVAAGLSWTRGRWGIAGNLLWHSGWQSNELRVVAGMPGDAVELAPRNSKSWPDYISLDLRGTWTLPLPRGTLQMFAEVNNVTDRNNPCCSDYRAVTSPAGVALSREISTWMPRIPMLGVSWQLP